MTFPREPKHPEVPFPFAPRPQPPATVQPVLVPTVGLPDGDLAKRLFERRTIVVGGRLDTDVAVLLCAQLMALDGESARDVELIVNSPGGPLADISSVLDVLELMRAPVNTTCVGTARATAAVLVACGTGRRRAAPHATLSLRCDHPESIDGSAAEITRLVEEFDALRLRVQEAVAAACGRSVDEIAAEIDHGGVHDAVAAQRLGLIDTVTEQHRRS